MRYDLRNCSLGAILILHRSQPPSFIGWKCAAWDENGTRRMVNQILRNRTLYIYIYIEGFSNHEGDLRRLNRTAEETFRGKHKRIYGHLPRVRAGGREYKRDGAVLCETIGTASPVPKEILARNKILAIMRSHTN